jgi:hypothetical protein
MFFFNLVESFKERNQKIKYEAQKQISKKNNEQLIRHENNIVKLNIENEKIAKVNEERDFKKYCAFYWQRKMKEKENKKRIKQNNNKLQEKVERLIELEKLNEKRRDNILQKIKNMDIRKEQFEKSRYEKLLENKKLREQRFESCAAKRKDMLLEESERRKDILFYQSIVLGRSLSRDNIFHMKKRSASEKTLNEQMILERNLTLFNKKMNALKSQSIYKKTLQERYKIFKDLKKKEAERKKEQEEKLK